MRSHIPKVAFDPLRSHTRMMATLEVPTADIRGWASFHEVLARALSFPPYYGANTHALIDCLYDIAARLDVPPLLDEGDSLTIDLGDVSSLRHRLPDALPTLTDCTAFVNAQMIDEERRVRVSLAYRG